MGALAPIRFERDSLADIHTTEKKLEREIAPVIERALPGVEVLAVELTSPTRFCVFVDHPEGVDHGLCQRVSQLLESYRETYAVDVSSPGLDRPLRKPAHFERAVGRTVALRTKDKIAGKSRFRGELRAAGDTTVKVSTGETELDIPYELIVRGNLIEE